MAIVTKDPIAKLLFSLTADNKVSPKEIISGISGNGNTIIRDNDDDNEETCRFGC